jgi:serine/threonine protein kinase
VQYYGSVLVITEHSYSSTTNALKLGIGITIILICVLYTAMQSNETLSVYLEYVSGISIHKMLQLGGPLGEALLRNYTAQILSGLAYLHGHNTVHRYWKVIYSINT